MTRRAGAIARPRPAAYGRRVSSCRIAWFVALLALLLSPLAAVGSVPAQAMAHHAGFAVAASGEDHGATAQATRDGDRAAMDHCEEATPSPAGDPDTAADCCGTCIAASGIPAVGGQLALQALAHRPSDPSALPPAPDGLHPEAATPPPRLS